MKKTLIFGNNIIAEMIYHDAINNGSDIEFIAFVVDEEYLKGESFCGLPQISFNEVLNKYPSSDYNMLSTVYLTTNLRERMKIYNRIKDAKYYMPNYVSKLSDMPNDTIMGENNIVMAFTHVGLHGKMGNFNFIRQNCYLGHHFNLADGNIIASGCSIGGRCVIGSQCFIGIGAIMIDRVVLADETLVGAGAVVTKDTEPYIKYVGNPAKPVGTHIDTGIVIKGYEEKTNYI